MQTSTSIRDLAHAFYAGVLAVLVLAATVTASTQAAASPSEAGALQEALPCVAIADFDNASGLGGRDLGTTVAARLAELLAGTGRLSIIGPAEMSALISGEETTRRRRSALNPDEIIEAAAREGCGYVLVGSIIEFTASERSGGLGRFRVSSSQAEVTLRARLLESSAGDMVEALEGSGSKRFTGVAVPDFNVASGASGGYAIEAMGPAVEELVEQIIDLAPGLDTTMVAAAAGTGVPALEGEVVGAPGTDRVYIDLGENRGIQVGMRFAVLQVADTIRDAEGNVLDRIFEPAGVIEVVQVLSKSAVCEVVDGTAQVGDLVQLSQ